MPDRRAHRGPHPEDARLFAAEVHATLRQATGDLCWLMSRGYAHESSLKLVGDRYGLVSRQRIAVARCACSNESAADRQSRQVAPEALRGRPLWIDGYNVLTTIEAALGGGVLLLARDGALRDMASMHGSYRKVAETLPALDLLGRTIADLGVTESLWYLDRPVSNSGRLKGIMEQLAADRGWAWRVDLVDDPDAVLIETARASVGAAVEPDRVGAAVEPDRVGAAVEADSVGAAVEGDSVGAAVVLPPQKDDAPDRAAVQLPPQRPDIVVASADSAILDHCDAWLNLARETVERHVPGANVVDLYSTQEPGTPPLSDDELTAAAAEIFLELDRREAKDD